MKKMYSLLAALMVLSMVLAACTPVATEAPMTEAPMTEAPMTEAPTEAPADVIKVGQVTDLGGIDDKTFNATAWAGVEEGIANFGVEGKYLESQQQSDYAKNIQQFLDEDTSLIVTVGFLLGVDTAVAAKANPDTYFAIVDYSYPDCFGDTAVEGQTCGSASEIPNVLGLTFKTDEAAFLAGYLAAGMTETGKVGTYGGIPIPPVTIFMTGYEAGVNHYNTVHGTAVEVLGIDLFTGNFESTDDGRAYAENLVQEGADIIMPVAGPVGLGSAAVCAETGSCKIIGVDTDMVVAAPEYESVILTSVLKNMNVAVYDAINAVVDGNFAGGTYVGTLDNGGVGVAPFHAFDGDVPAELKAELEQLQADIISGAVTVGQ
jgi:basic membrane protein A